MKIIDKRERHVLYAHLTCGDVFLCDGKLYMLTDQPEEDMPGEYKSVGLGTGEMEIFGKAVNVELVKCSLVME